VTGAVFDEERKFWQVRTSAGEAFTSRYLVTALRLLAKSNIPDIPGRDSFGGPLVHTNAWPHDLDITGKRVGVIGTGSTGTQFIVAAEKQAGNLTVFQLAAVLRAVRQRPRSIRPRSLRPRRTSTQSGSRCATR
jgi:cation diffusion facilitator CzcD-associated flavoprotein CzcO